MVLCSNTSIDNIYWVIKKETVVRIKAFLFIVSKNSIMAPFSKFICKILRMHFILLMKVFHTVLTSTESNPLSHCLALYRDNAHFPTLSTCVIVSVEQSVIIFFSIYIYSNSRYIHTRNNMWPLNQG